MPDQPLPPPASRLDVVIGIIVRDGQILISRRRRHGSFANMWEFPGGKREGHESLPSALIRELREELGIAARLVEPLPPIDHDYATMRIRLHPWICETVAGEPQPLASEELRWIAPERLSDYTFPEGNAVLLNSIVERLRGKNRKP